MTTQVGGKVSEGLIGGKGEAIEVVEEVLPLSLEDSWDPRVGLLFGGRCQSDQEEEEKAKRS